MLKRQRKQKIIEGRKTHHTRKRKETKMKKRLVSLFLALAIIVTMMPYNLWAREGGGLEDQKNRMAEILGETEKFF